MVQNNDSEQPRIYRVTLEFTLPRNPNRIAARMRMIEEILCIDTRVILYRNDPRPKSPMDELCKISPGEFPWEDIGQNVLGGNCVKITLIAHPPAFADWAMRSQLLRWHDGLRYLRISQLKASEPVQLHKPPSKYAIKS